MAFGNYPIEVVEWIDHHSYRLQDMRVASDWVEHFEEPCRMRSVGFVIHEDDVQILLAWGERGDNDLPEPEYQSVFSIRKELVQKRTVLRKP